MNNSCLACSEYGSTNDDNDDLLVETIVRSPCSSGIEFIIIAFLLLIFVLLLLLLLLKNSCRRIVVEEINLLGFTNIAHADADDDDDGAYV